MPRKKYRKSRAMGGVKEGSSQLEVQEICQEQDTHNPPICRRDTGVRPRVWQVLVHLRAKGKESFPGLWSRKKISSAT